MADYVLSAVLSLRDQFTAKAKNAQKSIQGVKAAATGAAPAINGISSTLDRAGRSADTAAAKAERLKRSLSAVRGNYYATLKGRDELTPLLNKVQARLNRVTGSKAFSNLRAGIGAKLQEGLGGMASGLMMGAGMQMLGGAGIGFGLYNGVKSAMDFESAMSGVRAITNASQEDFEKLRNKALEMGATTKFTATESAQALNFMGMAGWNADQSVKGLPGIMHLAAASGEDLAMVSDIVTDSMSAFNLAAEKSGEFADVLAAAATKSNTNVGKMGFTFKYAAPLAGALGYSIQDVALAVGTMADSGIKGEQAGTSLRSLFTRLAKQPKEAAAAMAQLGIKIKDDTGKMKPLRSVLDDLRKSFRGLSEDQKTQYAAMLAGTEGMSGLLAIVNGDEKKFRELTKAIDGSSGAAERMAKIRLDNLSGDLTYLSSAWDGLILKVMKGDASSGLRGFVQELNSLVNHFSKSIDKNGLGVQSVLDLVGKAVIDLKNKFLQLDGVGSILAGGALAGGLYKIYKGAKSIADMVGGGVKTGMPGAGSLGGSMSSMTVQAGTVIVNGSSVAGGGLPGTGGAADTVGTAGQMAGGAGAAGKWGKLREIAGKRKAFKTFSKFAIPLQLAMTGYETYNAEPDKQAETAARGLSGLAGAEVGAAIGTAIAGPIGTVVGGALGHLTGTAVMDNALKLDVFHQVEMDELDDYARSNFKLTEDDIMDIRHENSALKVLGVTEAEVWKEKDGIINSAEETGSAISDEFRKSADESASAWSAAAGTISGIFDRIKAASSGLGGASIAGLSVEADATGTLNFPGGLAQIHEHGGELVDLPSGSRIYPAGTTERIIQRELQTPRSNPTSVNISGNTFVVREEADIDKIAYRLMQMMDMAELNYGGA